MVRVTYLDGWRGLAILVVLAGHFYPIPGVDLGRLGVELFFVLSGRLMADLLFVQRVELGEFFKRRFGRVWPGLAAMVVILTAVLWLSPLQIKLPYALTAITFTANYSSALGHRTPALDHVWSVCIEEHAYLLLGLLALAARRRKRLDPRAVVVGLMFLAMLDGTLCTWFGGRYSDYYAVYWRSDTRVASILAGAAAFLFLKDRRLPVWAPPLFGVAGIALHLAPLIDPLKYSLGSACLAVALVGLPSAPAVLRKALSSPPLVVAGLYSYSLYLWQQPFYKLKWYASQEFLLLGAVCAGVVSFHLIEQPARRFVYGLRLPRLGRPVRPALAPTEP